MLRHMQDGVDADACSIEAVYRGGAPQKNLVLSYLLMLVQHPELIEGFAAVMSDGFNGCSFADANLYANLTLPEMRGAKHDASFQAILGKMIGAA